MAELHPSQTKRTRNRPQTEEKLRQAVIDLLGRGGFGALTPSAVGKQAGVDKMLIYRYFDDLPGLVRSVAFATDFFPRYEDLCPPDEMATLRAMPVGERASLMLDRYAMALMARPAVLELMVWELVERNALTAIMEDAREALGLKIMSDLFSDVEDPRRLAAVSAVLSAGVAYLALRRRKIRWFNGLDLQSDQGWSDVRSAIRDMAAVDSIR
jgi:AcrR family transcriptional regulator